MANIMFLYNNLFDSATLTESSYATGFPCENLQNPFRTKVWRTAGGTPGTANLVIDHGSAKAITCVALVGYNWTSAPGTLNLEFNATDSWGSPSATEALTWAANPTANGNHGIIVKIFDSKSYRYNRLNVVYSTGDWDLGRIFLGTYFQPTYNFKWDHSITINDESYVSQTVGGQDHIDIVNKYRTVDFDFIAHTQAQWESFQAMIHHVGKSKDLVIAFDYSSEPDEMTIYGKFTSLSSMQRAANSVFNIETFTFKESR